MFNKVARLSPAFQGYTLFDTGGDLRNFTTMQIVNQGGNYSFDNGSPDHSLSSSTMQAGWENDGYYLSVYGWDIRFNIDLSSIPERARYGKISFSAPACVADTNINTGSPELIGRTQYRDASGSYIDLLPAYGASAGSIKFPGDCSFITTETVSDYIESQGGILQLRIRNTATTSSGGWQAASRASDDIRVQKIEIVGA